LSPNQIFYKTGDTVRVNEHGILEYLGRNDNQIKRNGVRLELGEIEDAASSHPSINSAIVVTRMHSVDSSFSEHDSKTTTVPQLQLLLYYTGVEKVAASELNQHLNRHLPKSAIPDMAVWLEAMPMNANGKTDRSKLPEPSQHDNFSSSSYQAPKNDLQKTWQIIWMEVIGLSKVGVNDDFFKIGGNSLLAIKLISEINSCGYQYSPMDVFNNPTIIQLSKLSREETEETEQNKPEERIAFSHVKQDELEKLRKLINKTPP